MKQETLEEAAEKYAKQFDYAEDSSPYIDFTAGAKWQQEQFKNESTANYIDRHIVEALVETAKQERSYSDEEVLKLLINFSDDRTFLKKDVAIQWFNKFKKK